MKLTNEQKDEIRLLLQNYVARYPSQNKAANSLVGISAGTLSTILNGRYETISDDMFTKLRAQIAGQRGEDWQLSPTMVYQELSMLLTRTSPGPSLRPGRVRQPPSATSPRAMRMSSWFPVRRTCTAAISSVKWPGRSE